MLKAIIVSALFLSVPFFSFAGTTITKNLCSYTTLTKVTLPEFNPEATKSALSKSVGNTDFCSDNRVTLTPLGAIVEETTCICQKTDSAEKNQELLDSIGCGPNQTQPKITISIDKRISGCKDTNIIISKCSKDPKAAYEAQCQSGFASPDDLDETDNTVTIDRTPWSIGDLPTFSVPDESQSMVSALTRAGVSPAEAQRLSTEQPQNAQEYIRALVEGNPDEIKASAAKLEINPNLSSNVRSLTADAPPPSSDTPDRVTEGAPTQSPSSAGFQPPLTDQEKWTGEFPTQCGIPGVAGLMMRSESGCGKVTRTARSDARGPYGFLCPSWNSFAQTTGYGQYSCQCSGWSYVGECSFADDVQLGAAIVNARYDMYRTQYGDTCAAINQRWETCAYAMHFAGETGFRNLVAAYQANPNQQLDPATVSRIFMTSGAYSANREVFERSGTVGGLFTYMEARLRGDSITSTYYTATGVTTNTGYSLNPNYGNLFTNTSGPAPSQTPVVMSPFANASLFSGLLTAVPQQGVQQTVQQPMAQQVAPQPKAQVSLSADPHIGKAGDPFTFTWMSRAINTQIGCTLALPGSSTVPVAPSGKQTVTIRNPQIYTLIFTCRGLDGTPAVAQDTVFVQ